GHLPLEHGRIQLNIRVIQRFQAEFGNRLANQYGFQFGGVLAQAGKQEYPHTDGNQQRQKQQHPLHEDASATLPGAAGSPLFTASASRTRMRSRLSAIARKPPMASASEPRHNQRTSGLYCRRIAQASSLMRSPMATSTSRNRPASISASVITLMPTGYCRFSGCRSVTSSPSR